MSTTLKFKKIFTTSCLLTILSILAVLSIQTLNPQKASAATTSDVMIGSDAPMTGSMINTAAAIARPYFAVGTGTLSSSTDNKYAYAKVYLPIDATTGKNYQATVTIKWGAGVCPGGPQPQDTGTPNVDYNFQDMSDAETLISGNFVPYFATVNSLSAGNTCGDKVVTIPAGSALASTITGHTSFGVIYFEAVINNAPATDNLKVFYITASSTTGTAYASMSRPVKNYGTGGSFAHDQNYFALTNNPGSFTGFSYSVQVSPRCGEYATAAAIPSSSIGMYDADNAFQSSLQFTVLQLPKYSAASTWPAAVLTVPASGLGNNNQYNSTSMAFSAYNNTRYKLNYNNFTTLNTLQTKLPFDQFDAINNCYSSTCTPVYAPSTVRPGVPLLISMKMGNAGTVSWDGTQTMVDSTYYITRNMTLPPTVTPVDPGENAYFNFSITDNVLGVHTLNYQMKQGTQYFGAGMIGYLNGPCSVTYTIADVPVATVDASCKRINSYVWFPNALATTNHSQMYMEDITPQNAYNTPPNTTSFNTGLSTETSPIIVVPGGYNPATADLTGTTPTGSGWFSFDIFQTGYNTGPGAPSSSNYYIYAYPTGHGTSFSSYNLLAWHTYRFTIMGQDKAGSPTLLPLSLPGGGLAQATIGPCMDFSCTVETNPASANIGDTVTYTFHPVINNRTNDYFNDTIGGSGYNIYSNNIFTTGLSNVVTNPAANSVGSFKQYVVPALAGVNNYGSGAPPGYTVTATVASLPYSASLGIGFGTGIDYTRIPAGLSSATGCSKTVVDYKKPYFKVFNGDVSAGGGFNVGTGSNNCSSANPVPANYRTDSDIKAYSDSSTTGYTGSVARRIGSSADFAAFALGVVSGDSASGKGFYSGLPFPTDTAIVSGVPQDNGGSPGQLSRYFTYKFTNPLTFANSSSVTSATQWGGGYNNVHCIPDWYGAFSNGLTINTAAPHAVTYNLNNAPDNAAGNNNRVGIWGDTGVAIQDDANAGNIPNSSAVIKNRRTVVVLGDAYIKTNIINDPAWKWSSASSQPPQLTLIVKGNIYIDPSVTRLDGVFVAQYWKSSPAQVGDIVTCGYGFAAASANQVTNNCGNQLTINGSVIAEHIKLLRTNGSVAAATAAGVTESLGSSPNAAEIINASPLLSIGSAFFNDDSVGKVIKADSLLNLPPVL